MSGSGLAGLEAADLAVGDREGPAGAHLAPGLIAVRGDQRTSAVLRRDHVEVAMTGEDLPFGPFGRITVGPVVRHGRVRGKRVEERAAVPAVDGLDQRPDGRLGNVIPGHHLSSHRRRPGCVYGVANPATG